MGSSEVKKAESVRTGHGLDVGQKRGVLRQDDSQVSELVATMDGAAILLFTEINSRSVRKIQTWSCGRMAESPE